MVTTVRARKQPGLARTFDSLNPATSEVIGTFPVTSEEEAGEAVARAHEAALWWAKLGWKERQTGLLAWKSYLVRYIGRLAALVHAETGKPLADAQLEIFLAVVHIDWAARHARRVLGPHRVRSGIPAINLASSVEYAPLGVIGVIGPWNYPVFTPMGSIAYVMAACADNLTPMIAECGGKDAFLVGADADLDAAADAAAWGAVSNAGQTCIGVERVYVVDSVYHTFLEKLAERMTGARPGDDRESAYGPMTRPAQADVVEDHIADA